MDKENNWLTYKAVIEFKIQSDTYGDDRRLDEATRIIKNHIAYLKDVKLIKIRKKK